MEESWAPVLDLTKVNGHFYLFENLFDDGKVQRRAMWKFPSAPLFCQKENFHHRSSKRRTDRQCWRNCRFHVQKWMGESLSNVSQWTMGSCPICKLTYGKVLQRRPITGETANRARKSSAAAEASSYSHRSLSDGAETVENAPVGSGIQLKRSLPICLCKELIVGESGLAQHNHSTVDKGKKKFVLLWGEEATFLPPSINRLSGSVRRALANRQKNKSNVLDKFEQETIWLSSLWFKAGREIGVS